MTTAEEKELQDLRAWKARVEPVLHRIYDVLYFDTDTQRFDPDKEWDSAVDFLTMVDMELIGLYGSPKYGTVDYPKIKGL